MAQPSSICSSLIVRAGRSRIDVAVRGVDQEPALQAVGDDAPRRRPSARGRSSRPGSGCRGSGSGSSAAQRLEVAAEPLADRPAALEQAVLLDRLDRRQPGPAGDRVAAEGAGVHPRLERRGDLAAWRSSRPPRRRRPAPWRRSGCRARCRSAGRRTTRRSGPCRSAPRRGSAARPARRRACGGPAGSRATGC